MLNLIRAFTITGAIVLFAVSGALVFIVWRALDTEADDYLSRSSLEASRNLSYIVAPYIPPIIDSTDDYREAPSLLLETQLAQEIKQAIHTHTYGSSVETVDVLSPEGLVVYSTRSFMLFKTRRDDGFNTALGGEQNITPKIIRKSSGQAENALHYYYTAHIPVFNSNLARDSEIIAVIAVTSNFSDLHQQLESRKYSLMLMILLITMTTYGILLGCLYMLRRHYLGDRERYRELKRKLEKTTFNDPLTGLPNRRQFIQELSQLIEIRRRVSHENFAILLTDLDSFKTINESLGHKAGNELLKAVAERLKSSVPEDALVARMGGDEFGIIISGIDDVSSAISTAKHMHKALSERFIINNQEITETTSIGIAFSQGFHLNTEDMIRDADIAMYRAKKRGRGQYELFNKHMHVEAMQRIEVENDIRRGIESDEFFSRYHPIIDLETDQVSSLEALVRWAHPTKRELSPIDFLPIAEEIGLVENIDRSVLTKAIHDLSVWREAVPELSELSVNVNHSARNFNNRQAMDNIFTSLQNRHVDGSHLKIELTESSILKNEMLASNMFEQLRAQGIHLCMDDFGTGFSSLSYLRKLNFDMLKIDQSFVRDMPHSEEARKIVRTIIDMGSHLGIAVTAEGVETEDQLMMLKSMGCQYAQGYYYTKPLRNDEVISFIRGRLTTQQSA